MAEQLKGLELMNDMTLNYHLMHPGGDSIPGDPNAAFCLDGVYHLKPTNQGFLKAQSDRIWEPDRE